MPGQSGDRPQRCLGRWAGPQDWSRARRDGGALEARHLTTVLGEEGPDLVRRITIHEAGHAIVRLSLGRGRIRHIIVSSRSIEAMPEGAPRLVIARDYEEDVACHLGGRAAEERVLGSVSSGEAADLPTATELAVEMELKVGLSGALFYTLTRCQGCAE